jgi:hypothetical protein
MFREEVKEKIAQELLRGQAAQSEGLEGRARVCARRAAGAAAREYLRLKGLPAAGDSAYDLLVTLQNLAQLDPQVRVVAGHMLERVDETFSLPGQTDLLEEARWLAEKLEADLR